LFLFEISFDPQLSSLAMVKVDYKKHALEFVNSIIYYYCFCYCDDK